MRASALFPVLALAAVAACGHRAVVEEPAPEPAPAPAPPPPAPAPAPAPRDDRADRERLERERAERERAERARAVAADLAAMIHFDYNQAQIRQEDRAVLDRKVAILQANPGVKIRVGGHADERGSDEYNLALGNQRAAAAKRYLEGKGVDGSRIDATSYGEERPLAQGADEAAWSQNRRDEFEITAGGDNLVPTP